MIAKEKASCAAPVSARRLLSRMSVSKTKTARAMKSAKVRNAVFVRSTRIATRARNAHNQNVKQDLLRNALPITTARAAEFARRVPAEHARQMESVAVLNSAMHRAFAAMLQNALRATTARTVVFVMRGCVSLVCRMRNAGLVRNAMTKDLVKRRWAARTTAAARMVGSVWGANVSPVRQVGTAASGRLASREPASPCHQSATITMPARAVRYVEQGSAQSVPLTTTAMKI
jgi:hypothetical protein